MSNLIPNFQKVVQNINNYMQKQESYYNGKSDIWDMHHYFLDGLYVREGTLPTDSLVIGKKHKFSHVVFLLKGRVLVADEYSTEEYIAPCMIQCDGHTSKVIYTIEEAHWFNVHATDKKTVEEAEDYLTDDI
jgi:hypothetical protein